MAIFFRVTRLYLAACGICSLLISASMPAQEDVTSNALAAVRVKRELQPEKEAFLRLDRCRTQLPAGALKDKFTEAESRLAEGLLIGWSGVGSWPATPPPFATIASRYFHSPSAQVSSPPALYLQSLQNDASACNAAISGTHNPSEASTAMQIVVADLIVKARDCFAQGMGRLVGIQVATKRGSTPDPGWTVYYKWVSVSDIPTAETPFQTSSTPAKDKLPPGIYQLRAEKSLPGSASVLRSEVKMVPLDSTHDKCELQVP